MEGRSLACHRTAVPTRLGFWTSWIPWTLPKEWPFYWWVAAVLGHYSGRDQGCMVFEGKPTSRTLGAFLGRTIRDIGTTPRYFLSDMESTFMSKGRRWCRRMNRGMDTHVDTWPPVSGRIIP